MIELLLEADRALSVGMIDRAERLYRTVAERDPKNAIAVVGLARVTLERGDEAGAYEHVKRALELDPQNQPALRMEARLSEILVTRGKHVDRPEFVRPRGSAPRATPWPTAGVRHAETPSGQRPSAPSGPDPSASRPTVGPEPSRRSPAGEKAPRKRLLRRLLGR